jgi:zinc protease
MSALAIGLVVASCAGSPLGPTGGARGAGALAESGDLAPPVRETLPNGFKLIVQEHWAADIVAIQLWVAAGVRDEGPAQLGDAHFQEHMLFKGTDTWGPGHIDRVVEGVGGRKNAVTSLDYTTYFMTLPADHLESGVQILAGMAFRSIFDPGEIDRERQVIFQEARIEQDNPRTAMIRQLYAMAFEGSPYGRSPLGTPETLDAATRDRLLAYYRLHYTPSNMALVVVGPVRPADVKAIVEGVFGPQANSGFKRGPAPGARTLSGRSARDVERPEQQAMLGMAWIAPKADDVSGYAIDLLTTIIAGTESSRLAQSLRDRDGLVQSIRMSYAPLQGAGLVTVLTTAEAKDLPAVEQAVLAEIKRIQEEGVTEEERQLAITRAEAQFAFDRETSDGLAFAYGIAETTWSLDEELRYIDTLRGITREQIREAARRWLPTTGYARVAFAPPKASR